MVIRRNTYTNKNLRLHVHIFMYIYICVKIHVRLRLRIVTRKYALWIVSVVMWLLWLCDSADDDTSCPRLSCRSDVPEVSRTTEVFLLKKHRHSDSGTRRETLPQRNDSERCESLLLTVVISVRVVDQDDPARFCRDSMKCVNLWHQIASVTDEHALRIENKLRSVLGMMSLFDKTADHYWSMS